MLMEEHRQEEAGRLLADLDFSALYREYAWRNDTWEKGFPDILRLEREVTVAARSRTLGLDHVRQVARWGGLAGRFDCPDPLAVTLYVGDAPAYWLVRDSGETVRDIERQVRGFGPTYASKLLRFAVPQVFGALDTRLVRVFGRGDPAMQRYALLDLAAEQFGSRWAIPVTQPGWPGEYGTWTGVLHALASALNREEVCCPHPAGFAAAGLRSRGIWVAADVEMALFSYASAVVREPFKSETRMREQREDSITGAV
ncbi:hypothetical protein [Methanoculleus caldifontis]|uniref:hypothetical protein n=1 Tax=Methanoculleus caldifontis TaxID=2651577 RepID=UPI0029372C7A|nr:hypothetical protein [Methanoculleus sp. Wushi-C6]